jgi:hypothetical protein
MSDNNIYDLYQIFTLKDLKKKPLECSVSVQIQNESKDFYFFMVEKKIYATFNEKTQPLSVGVYSAFDPSLNEVLAIEGEYIVYGKIKKSEG